MAIRLSDIFPIGGSRPAHVQARMAQDAARRGKGHAARRRPRTMTFEPVEPRLLLSADSAVAGITTALTTGLSTFGQEIGQVLDEDTQISALVPGFVTQLTLGDNVYQISPTMQQALGIKVDVSKTVKPSDSIFPIASSAAARFEQITNIYPAHGAVDANADEFALSQIDLNADGRVELDEAFEVMVRGQIEKFLREGTFADADDLRTQVSGFLTTNLNTTIGLLNLADRVNVIVTGVSSSLQDGTLRWTMDLRLSLIQSDAFDLGYEAATLGLDIDPKADTSSPYSVPVARTLHLQNFSFGVRGVGDGTVSTNDFFFDAPSARFEVRIGSPGAPYDNGLTSVTPGSGLKVNVGFLGAEVWGATGNGIMLDMGLKGGVTDPSSPVALGFDVPASGLQNTSGLIEADNVADTGRLAVSPIDFKLRIGALANAAFTEVVVAQGSYASTADVLAAVNTGLAATVLNGIVSATDADADGKVGLRVVETDPTPLGFAAEQSAVATLNAGVSSLLGDITGTTVKFLLSVNGAAPKLVTVVTTPLGDDPNGTPGDADDDTVSIAGLRDDVQLALNAAFGAGVVTAGINGDKLKLTAGGALTTLEISRTLTLRALDEISYAELTANPDAQLIDVAVDGTSRFEVDLKLRALSGLEKTDGTPYLPTGTVKVDIDPFADVDEREIDKDPVTDDRILSAKYGLTDAANKSLAAGASDLQAMLDFNVVSVADVLASLTQISTWFNRVSASSVLQGFDIPFADTSLGDVLNLADRIADGLLIDDGDDGAAAPTASTSDFDDTGKLLAWLPKDPLDLTKGVQLRPTFLNAQQLQVMLTSVLGTDAQGTVSGSVGSQELSYRIVLADAALDVDPEAAGAQPLVVPLDFELDLGPVANVQTSGQLEVTAAGGVGFTLGLSLGNVSVLDAGTDLEDLNAGKGVVINTNLALTSLGEVTPLVGRLTSNAQFTLTWREGGVPQTPATVSLARGATSDNLVLGDLVTDLNAALAASGLGAKFEFVAEALLDGGASDPGQTSRLVLRPLLSTIDRFQIEAQSLNLVPGEALKVAPNAAVAELGLTTQSAWTVALVGTAPIPRPDPGAALSFTLQVKRSGDPTAATSVVSLPAALTGGNTTLQALIDDLNSVLPTGIVASVSAGRLALSAVDADIAGFTVSDCDALGLDVAVAEARLQELGVTSPPSTVLVAGPVLRAVGTPLDPFSRLASDLSFTVNGQALTLTAAEAASHYSLRDFAKSLNAKLAADPVLGGKVAAVVDGGRIALVGLSLDMASITVAGLSAAESAASGLANLSTATANALRVRSAANAPLSFGVRDDAAFTLTLDGTAYTGTLSSADTDGNRSVYDLAASLNKALTAAIGPENPLVATVQTGRIVIGQKTTGSGYGLLGEAATPVSSFSLNSSSLSFQQDLRLLDAAGTARAADRADLVIHLSDGTSHRITFDTVLDANGDGLLDATLGFLQAYIQSQVPDGKLSVEFAPDGTSLRLKDNTWTSASTGLFRVEAVNGSPAAARLGILASDETRANVDEVDASPSARTRDGVIDGGRIAVVELVDRVFLEDVGAQAELTLKTGAQPVTAEASFGFAGMTLSVDASSTLFSAEAALPLFDSRQTLRGLFDAVAEPGGATLSGLLGTPTLTLDGDLTVKVSADLGPGFTDPSSTATLTFETDAVVITPASLPTLAFSVTTTGFEDLLDFGALTADDVFDAVAAIADFLAQFEEFGFLGDEIPVLGLSVNDLVDIADRFAAAVEAFRSNPAGGIQQLGKALLEAFGLPEFATDAEAAAFFASRGIAFTPPAGYQLIQFALDANTLVLDLRLPLSVSRALSVELDLGDALGLGEVVDIQGGAGLAASAFLDARLKFGIDLSNPANVVIYDDVTGVFGGLSASATNLQFNAAIGPLGVFVKDGEASIDLGFSVNGNDGTAGPAALSDFLANLQASASGSASATLPVYFPSDSEYLGDVAFSASLSLDSSDGLDVGTPVLEVPDLSGIDLASVDVFGNIPLMLDALDFFLQGLQDILDGEVLGAVDLPLLGDQLQGGADFIEQLRKDVLKPLRELAEKAPELAKEVVQKLLYSLLGPGSSGVTLTNPLTGTEQSLSSFLGLSGEIGGLGLLVDYGTGLSSGVDEADIVTADDGTGAMWKFRLGGSADIPLNLAFDLGIPALALKSDAALDISLNWDLALGLGLNTEDGAYLVIGDHGSLGDEELRFTVAVDVRNGSALKGTLGFLQLEIEESTEDSADDLENEARGTYVEAHFTVDLRNSSDSADTKLSFSELGNLDADIGIDAEAEVNLQITGAFDPSIVPATVAALLPEITGRFVLDWETGDVTDTSFDFANSLKTVGFRDVQVDMGSFITDLVQPFVEKVAEVTEPLQPIIDLITAPIPVISDLAGQPVTLVDIAGMTGYVEPGLIYAIADIVSLVNELGSGTYDELFITLGDFMFVGGGTGTLTGAALTAPGFTVQDASVTMPTLGSFGSLLDSASGSPTTKNTVSSLSKGELGGGFTFPIFDDPASLFGLLLGKDVTLIGYDMAPFKMEFSYAQKFPIWDALFVRIGGSAGLTIDLAFGYDTKGVREFADGGFGNPLDLLAGLFVSDTASTDGSGVDVPELILKGELFAGAELNLGVASAGAEGVIGLVANFDLYDPDSDGKVRIDELVGNVLFEAKYGEPLLAPLAIFDIYGEVYAQLRAFVESVFFSIDFEITPPITLFEFSVPFTRAPFLATERGDGSLLLNVGPNAAQRLNGDTRDIDETVYVKSVSDSEVLVWGLGIAEADAQSYKVDKNLGIFAYGGSGNDLIDLSQVGHGIRYTLEGGVGDDQLKGSAGGGSMKGDQGNDVMTGGAGRDLMTGGEGNDRMDGGGEADVLFGDSGSTGEVRNEADAVVGTRYRAFAGDKDGDDQITGGDGNDIILAGGGSDRVRAGEGDDIVIGDGGNFDTDLASALTRDDQGRLAVNARGAGGNDDIQGNGGDDQLFGGGGNDLIDGGAGADEVEGGSEFDVLYGGSGGDTLYGGSQDDLLFGKRDPDGAAFGQSGDTGDAAADGNDSLFGEDGNDFIRGQDGDDSARGGRGADIVFGDAGADQVLGEAGGDILFGGAGSDFVDGSEGADVAFGDEGLVAYKGFDVSKPDFTTLGSRIRFIAGAQIIGDADASALSSYAADAKATSVDLMLSVPAAGDGSDTVVGGSGDDILFGGGGTLDRLYGDYDPVASFTGPRPNGQDIAIGDGGRVEWQDRRVSRVAAQSNALDGQDEISGNDGADYLFGGGLQDTLQGFQAGSGVAPLEGVSDNDIILGDNGEILFDTSDSKNRVEQVRTVVVASDSGASDVIDGDFGDDVILGGLNSSSDVLSGDIGDDILLGDNGEIIFDADGDLDTLDRVESFADAQGGGDTLSGNDGADLLIGGTGSDTMRGDAGEDILLGDNGRIDLAGNDGRLLVQVAAMPGATAVDRIRTTDTAESTGGADVMEGNADADVMFGGVGADTVRGDGAAVNNTADGDDVLVGDNGELDFTFGSDTERKTLDLVRSARDGLGKADTLSGNAGSDILVGGTAGDLLWGDSASAQAGSADAGDILMGDNADITTRGAFEGAARLTVLGTGIAEITTTDTAEGTGGSDTLSGQAGGDVIAGGVAGDVLYGDALVSGTLDGDDVLLGDNGRLRFDDDLQLNLTPAAVFDLRTLDRVETFTDGLGGADTISGQRGRDLAIGGTAGDTVHGDDATASSGAADGGDMLLGDNGVLRLVDPALDGLTPDAGSQRVTVLGGAAASLRSTDESGPGTGGEDTLSGNAGGDIVMGGVAGDLIYGDRSAAAATNANDGADVLLGDNGQVEWLSAGRLAEVTGIDLAATNADLVAGFAARDVNLDTIDLITTEQPTNGGRDTVYGGNERDLIMGGTDADRFYGDTGSETDGTQSSSGNDLIFGDHGRLYPQFSRSANAAGALVASPAIHSRNFFAIDTGASAGGEGDRLWGEEGADILIGQQGDDRIWGGSGDDDLIGGHNVAGGADELGAAGRVAISIGADAFNDAMDGGGGNDALAGDNATVWRRGDSIDPRYRTLTGPTLYTVTGEASVAVNVDGTHRGDPDGTVGRDITLRDHGDGVAQPLWGRDAMAGGAGADALFGQMGNDLMQGDGLLDDVAKSGDPASLDVTVADIGVPSTAGDGSLAFNVPEAATDGRDYMEGNGGNDLMYGGLGQDDMVGGSSDLFGLTNPTQRPDGGDTIFGGAGVRLARLDAGDLPGVDSNAEFARDADQIAGDNATIHRIVTTGGGLASFNYDTYGGAEKIVVRAVRLLDYTPGGPDYDSVAQAGDRGAGDHIRGEAGNDFIHGMAGSDILFGDGQDDDLIGGYGHDWVSGGNGQDGIVGDDGLIRTSRNSSTVGEPLFGIAALASRDPNTRESNGNVLGEVIATPGGIQTATIHVAGELLKSVDLTPMSVDRSWQALDDEFAYGAGNAATPYADDILYGGIGSDWLHGGSGDDAISGAEALPVFFEAAVSTRPQFFGPAPASRPSEGTTGGSTLNPGNVLRFNPTDTDGTGPNRERAGEFALYDEYNPMREVRVSSTDGWSGSLVPTGGSPFILNFAINEGVKRPSEMVSSGGNSTITTGEVSDDGQDKIFGGTGNDWLVGGTGRDNVYGGWGNDLINADDNHSTNGGLNNQPDTHSTYEDRVFGGAGRDVLIGNTGGDRLIDWVGEWNSYLVPFAPFGTATVSRTLQPQLPEYLYALSRADGADPTRAAYVGDPRNGEPNAELGLVLQKDQAWQDQTGAPADPQAGNIPGGQRDVLRSADFTGNQAQGFVAESGAWTVTNGRYEVRPNTATGTTDAVSLFYVDQSVPTYFEVAATINAVKPTAGFRANAYVVFDYVSATNFKFAGINISTNKIEIGQRTATGWQVMASINALLKQDTDYNTLLSVNGNAVTFVVNNTQSVSYAFQPRRDADGFTYSIRDGMVGLAGNNARARIDNVRVQVIPPAITYAVSDSFSASASTLLGGQAGSFAVQAGRYVGTPSSGAVAAIATNDIGVGVYSLLKLDTVLRSSGMAGVVFDVYSTTDFKWAGVSAATGQVLIGHYDARSGWVVDAAVARTVSGTADQSLGVSLKGSTASVTLNGQTALSFSFNSNVVDGAVGVFARGATASFDSFALSTDDPKLAGSSSTAGTTAALSPSSTSLTSSSPSLAGSTWTAGNSSGSITYDAGVSSGALRDLFPVASTTGFGITWSTANSAQGPAPSTFTGGRSAGFASGIEGFAVGAVTVGAAAPTSRPAAAVLVDETVARINWSVPAAPQATFDQDGRPSDRLWQESFVTDTAAPAKRAALPDLRIRL